jgi:hypothetical protein
MSKIIYLATTKGCEACRIMTKILKKVYGDNLYTFSIRVKDFKDIPSWITTNVPLNDFPTTIFIEDDVVKYHFSGTKTVKALQEIIIDLKFN